MKTKRLALLRLSYVSWANNGHQDIAAYKYNEQHHAIYLGRLEWEK